MIRQLHRKADRVRLRFTVSDTGAGMSEAFMSRLFSPFKQEEAFAVQIYGNTGLGMFITHVLLVEDNELNREITVELLKMADITVDWAVNGKEAVMIYLP